MAKKSKIAKERKREEFVIGYEFRKELKAKGDYEAYKFPRDSSPTRLTRRCKVTGRPEVYYVNLKCLVLRLENMRTKDKFQVLKNQVGKSNFVL